MGVICSAGTGVEEDITYPQFVELLGALAEHACRYEDTSVPLLDKILNLFMAMDPQSAMLSKKEFTVFQYVRRAMQQRLRCVSSSGHDDEWRLNPFRARGF